MLFFQRTTSRLAFLAASFGALSLAPAQRVVHVDAKAEGANDGTSWFDAYNDLQDALDDTQIISGCPCDIWIAEGTYKPDRGTGNRDDFFELTGNISLYGGFAGSELCRDDAMPSIHPTILSGDLFIDDADVEPKSDCCSVHSTGGCDDAACFQAVTSEPPRTLCALGWNHDCLLLAEQRCCELCRPTRCDNSHNILAASSTAEPVLLDGLIIEDGEGNGGSLQGNTGGVFSADTDLAINNCTFRGNAVALNAFSATTLNHLLISNSSFLKNGTTGRSKASVFTSGMRANVIDCEFRLNNGGGLWTDTDETIQGCRFELNYGHSSSLVIHGSPDVRGCLFLNNDYMAVDAGLYSPLFVNCRFFGNWSSGNGPGAMGGGAMIILENCLFSGNKAAARGDPIAWGSPGAFENDGFTSLRNCTFTQNAGGNIGTAYFQNAWIENSIFWNNQSNWGQGAGIYVDQPNTPVVRYSILQGQTQLYVGVGNLDADPMFVDPLGPDGVAGTLDDDLRLSTGSPCINAGDPSYQPASSETNLDGHARILCSRVDIGAYEFGIGDYDCNQIVNEEDFATWTNCSTGPMLDNSQPSYASACAAFDFDHDSDVDLKDFSGLQQIFVTP